MKRITPVLVALGVAAAAAPSIADGPSRLNLIAGDREPPDADKTVDVPALRAAALAAPKDREARFALVRGLMRAKQTEDAAKDLGQTLGDIPDSSLAADWEFLCHEMRRDLAQSPDKTLADLDSVRRRLLNTGNARMFYIGATATRQKLEPRFNELLTGFDTSALSHANYIPGRRVEARLAERIAKGGPWEKLPTFSTLSRRASSRATPRG